MNQFQELGWLAFWQPTPKISSAKILAGDSTKWKGDFYLVEDTIHNSGSDQYLLRKTLRPGFHLI